MIYLKKMITSMLITLCAMPLSGMDIKPSFNIEHEKGERCTFQCFDEGCKKLTTYTKEGYLSRTGPNKIQYNNTTYKFPQLSRTANIAFNFNSILWHPGFGNDIYLHDIKQTDFDKFILNNVPSYNFDPNDESINLSQILMNNKHAILLTEDPVPDGILRLGHLVLLALPELKKLQNKWCPGLIEYFTMGESKIAFTNRFQDNLSIIEIDNFGNNEFVFSPKFLLKEKQKICAIELINNDQHVIVAIANLTHKAGEYKPIECIKIISTVHGETLFNLKLPKNCGSGVRFLFNVKFNAVEKEIGLLVNFTTRDSAKWQLITWKNPFCKKTMKNVMLDYAKKGKLVDIIIE